MSDLLALSGIKLFASCLDGLEDGDLDDELRKNLIYAAVVGGMVIANTGVTVNHAMGYAYTCTKAIPHGQANGYLLPYFLEMMEEGLSEKVQDILEACGYDDIEGFKEMIEGLVGVAPTLTEGEVASFTMSTLRHEACIQNTFYDLSPTKIEALWQAMRQEGQRTHISAL